MAKRRQALVLSATTLLFGASMAAGAAAAPAA